MEFQVTSLHWVSAELGQQWAESRKHSSQSLNFMSLPSWLQGSLDGLISTGQILPWWLSSLSNLKNWSDNSSRRVCRDALYSGEYSRVLQDSLLRKSVLMTAGSLLLALLKKLNQILSIPTKMLADITIKAMNLKKAEYLSKGDYNSQNQSLLLFNSRLEQDLLNVFSLWFHFVNVPGTNEIVTQIKSYWK